MTTEQARIALTVQPVSALFDRIYPDPAGAVNRYTKALVAFEEIFGKEREVSIFSAPGRTEIGGNHTDHNGGRVMAGSVDRDVIAVVSPRSDGIVRIHSLGFSPDTVSLSEISPKPEEKGSSAALIRGVAAGFVARNLAVGGFDAYTESCVPKGGGVSSSAAFEVLLGTIFSHLYNRGSVNPVTLAKVGQEAERDFFGKPCGLMDQAACAMGGICMMDFADEISPVIVPVEVDFSRFGYQLCLVRPGGDHAGLTHLYARIPRQMKQVAALFGKEKLCDVSYGELVAKLPEVREKAGDAAALAALHFCQETERVPAMQTALSEGDFPRFLTLVKESGHSSFEALQNVWIPQEDSSQDAALALILAGEMLGDAGAWRIHGGGFGGTTQNFVPRERTAAFCRRMDDVFGDGASMVMMIRPVGPVKVL